MSTPTEDHKKHIPYLDPGKAEKVDVLVRTAVVCGIIGMLLVLLFLIVGFQAWSVGLGMFVGMPVLMLGILLYIIAVIRDLKYRNVLDD